MWALMMSDQTQIAVRIAKKTVLNEILTISATFKIVTEDDSYKAMR